jgi:hypothetical protein
MCVLFYDNYSEDRRCIFVRNMDTLTHSFLTGLFESELVARIRQISH